jgi:hypothetical protein
LYNIRGDENMELNKKGFSLAVAGAMLRKI